MPMLRELVLAIGIPLVLLPHWLATPRSEFEPGRQRRWPWERDAHKQLACVRLY